MKRVLFFLMCLGGLPGWACGGEVRWCGSLDYVQGASGMVDVIEESIGQEVDLFIPIGAGLHPYYEFSNGAQLGLDVGPFSFVSITVSSHSSWGQSSEELYFHFDLPIGLTYGLMFMPKADTSPYLRGGARMHVTGGDFADDAKPGLFLGGGFEFSRLDGLAIGLEVGYDTSEFNMTPVTLLPEFGEGEVSTRTVKPGKWIASLRFVF